MPDMQLDIFGGEVDHHVVMKRRVPIGPAQYAILDALGKGKTISAKEAGRIAHGHREPPCRHCQADTCDWATKDGHKALRGLKDRGYVRQLTEKSFNSDAGSLWMAT